MRVLMLRFDGDFGSLRVCKHTRYLNAQPMCASVTFPVTMQDGSCRVCALRFRILVSFGQTLQRGVAWQHTHNGDALRASVRRIGSGFRDRVCAFFVACVLAHAKGTVAGGVAPKSCSAFACKREWLRVRSMLRVRDRHAPRCVQDAKS